MLKFSIIVPVYNRPDEIDELLGSLTAQTDKGFEVLIVEDGSTSPCGDVCAKYEGLLDLHYLAKPNSGRSDTRNFGMKHASGDYFLIFDSDVTLPEQYIATVRKYLGEEYVDCFGGPDGACEGFSSMQKAISYSMTSFMTTGGIRGGTKNVKKFTPRSFNMGISRACFEKVGGYKNMIGEDIDLSFRIKEAGFETRLFPDAYVYHKRRVDLRKFYRQVNTFGRGRILLNKLHPGSLKPVHLLPTAFALGNLLLVLLALVFSSAWWLLPIGIYVICIFAESLIKNKSLDVAFKSIAAAYVQLFGYGFGFISELLTHKASKATQEELYR